MVTGSRPVKPLSRRLKKGVGMTSERTRKRLLDRLQSEGIHSESVLQAINAVPRHLFVDEALASRAYEDISLPIGYGQTISQPFVVALMTQVVIEDGVPDRVLEIGNEVIIQSGAVVGSEGYGFAQDEMGRSYRIPQLGRVVIEDCVSIGSGCCIDRATYAATRIGAPVWAAMAPQAGATAPAANAEPSRGESGRCLRPAAPAAAAASTAMAATAAIAVTAAIAATAATAAFARSHAVRSNGPPLPAGGAEFPINGGAIERSALVS